MDWDAAYANASYIPDAKDYVARWQGAAAAFRAIAGGETDLPYGSDPREVLDLFWPEGKARGLVVFVHGGYWLRFDASYWSHLAAGPLARGWAVAMPGYPLCPSVGLPRITRSVAQAICFAAERVAGPIHLAGHSAGGQLVARMPAVLPQKVGARLAHIMPISPLSDLRPLMRTAMRDSLHLDAEVCATESPALAPRPDMPATVWVGAEERPVFLDQARWLAEAWQVPLRIDPGRHHFDVIDGLTGCDTPITQTLLSAQRAPT